MTTLRPLGEIKIADSRFLGFCFKIEKGRDVHDYQQRLKALHPLAAHVPTVVWCSKKTRSDWDEDGEPKNSVGPAVLSEIEHYLTSQENNNISADTLISDLVAVIIVRYFGERFLGVTCGRLTGCYRSICRLTLHRFFFPNSPLVKDFNCDGPVEQNIYGMGAGDCELILNAVKDDDDDDIPINCKGKVTDSSISTSATNSKESHVASSLEEKIISELRFDNFKGSGGEELPRLQNLQADLSDKIIPIYRYPGNYSGDEWDTEQWSPTSFRIKQAVEKRLKPLINQTMNHCVTNYYRNGKDHISHHNDKVLDLNRDGVIVSVSLGDPRILELRQRKNKDLIRVLLPHRSMLVLGPLTNTEWTHSILPNESSDRVRISLTMRDVRTFKDRKTGRLFGQGVTKKTQHQVQKRRTFEDNALFFAGFCALSALIFSKKNTESSTMCKKTALFGGCAVVTTFGLRLIFDSTERKHEERIARDFFSKTSSKGTKY